MNVPTLRNAGLIARHELVRSRRRMTGSTSKKLQFAVLGLTIPLYSLGGAAGAFFLGAWIAGGDAPANVTAYLGAGLLAYVLFVGFFVVTHGLKSGGIDNLPGLLTTVPYEDVALGALLAMAGRVLSLLAIPIGLVAAAFGFGAGSILAGASVAAVLLAVTLVAVELGLVLAYGAKLLTGRFRILARHRSAIGFALSLLIPTAWILLSAQPSVSTGVFTALFDSPAAWVGHFTLLPLGGTYVDATLAVAGGLGLVATLFGGGLAAVALAGRFWYVDPVQPEHAHHRPEERRFDLFAGLPTIARAVARKSLRRARRAPFTVQFAVFPFFFLIWRLQVLVLEGRVPADLPVLLAVAGAMSAGAAFSLNPLGGEEGLLPMTLTARVTGWEFVGGLALAGATIGVPLVVVLPVLAGVGAGLDILSIAAAVIVGLVLTATGPGMASGLGVIFPKFERTTVGTGREVVVPSNWAFVGYIGLLLGAAMPGTIVAIPWGRGWLAGLLGVGEGLALAIGLLGTAVVAAGIALVGYAYAADRVGDYQIE